MFLLIFRFADLFGLDLADVKMYLDEVPRVPKSAFQDLKDAELSDLDSDSSTYSVEKELTIKTQHSRHPANPETPNNNTSKKQMNKGPSAGLKPLFVQPNGHPKMLNKLRDDKVSLETAYSCDAQAIIKGVARVVNLDYHKKVSIRYTLDDWNTSLDVNATYLGETCDGISDKFSFVIDTSSIMEKCGARLQFCIHFRCLGNDYWDNNGGANYVFQYIGGGRLTSPPEKLNYKNRKTGGIASSATPMPYAIPCRGLPITARGRQPGSGGSQRSEEICHIYQTLSHSPSALDDPWQQYL